MLCVAYITTENSLPSSHATVKEKKISLCLPMTMILKVDKINNEFYNPIGKYTTVILHPVKIITPFGEFCYLCHIKLSKYGERNNHAVPMLK